MSWAPATGAVCKHLGLNLAYFTLESCTPLFPKTPQLVSGLMKNARKKRTFDAWERKVLDGMKFSNENEVKNVTP